MDSPLSGRGKPGPDTVATDVTSRDLLAVAVLGLVAGAPGRWAPPDLKGS